MTETLTRLGWALFRFDGSIVVDCDTDEAGIWQIGLGWPTAREIMWHRAKGTRAVRVEVREMR